MFYDVLAIDYFLLSFIVSFVYGGPKPQRETHVWLQLDILVHHHRHHNHLLRCTSSATQYNVHSSSGTRKPWVLVVDLWNNKIFLASVPARVNWLGKKEEAKEKQQAERDRVLSGYRGMDSYSNYCLSV